MRGTGISSPVPLHLLTTLSLELLSPKCKVAILPNYSMHGVQLIVNQIRAANCTIPSAGIARTVAVFGPPYQSL